MAATEEAGFKAFSGLRNDAPPERLPLDALTEATNVDLDDTGAASRRSGYAKIVSGTRVHSVWANRDGTLCLFVDGDTMYRLNTDRSVTVIAVGLEPGQPVSYCDIGGVVYWVTEADRGVVRAGAYEPWGITPPGNPALSVAGGALNPGRYIVSCTFRAADGRESGAPEGSEITLPTGGGVMVRLPRSFHRAVRKVVVYMTNADGGTLYEAGVFDNPGDDAPVWVSLGGPEVNLQRPIVTQFMAPPPYGQIAAHLRGRVYVASGNTLYWSTAFGYDLFKVSDSMQFNGRITMVAACESGLFIGAAGKTWWADGVDPEGESFAIREASASEPIEGSLVYAQGQLVGEAGVNIDVPVWLSTRGVAFGLPGGAVNLMTEKWRFDPPDRSAGLFRKTGETHQYIASKLGG